MLLVQLGNEHLVQNQRLLLLFKMQPQDPKTFLFFSFFVYNTRISIVTNILFACYAGTFVNLIVCLVMKILLILGFYMKLLSAY